MVALNTPHRASTLGWTVMVGLYKLVTPPFPIALDNQLSNNISYSYAVGKIYMQLKCDKVRVIIAWGKNCREESDKVFAIGYQELVGF